jgi:hypothetical protein
LRPSLARAPGAAPDQVAAELARALATAGG